MNRRPLFVAATGFVLGEVCALLAEGGMNDLRAESVRYLLLGVLASGVLLFGVLDFFAKNKKRGRSMHGKRWILLLLCVFFVGYGRMAWEIREWERIEERIWEDEEVVYLTGKVVKIREKEKNTVLTINTGEFGKVLVYLEKEDMEKKEEHPAEKLRIGGTVKVKGEVSRFQKAGNPGEFDLKAYYTSLGISAAVFAWEVRWEEEKGYSPYLDALYRFRCFCGGVFERICTPEDEGIFRAAILGDKDKMEQEIKDLYQKNGIAHLLAISGLHLSLIGAGLHRILRRCGLGYGLSGLLAAAVIVSYGILTGASGSALRAVIMLAVSFLAAFLGRTYDLLSALSFALLLLSGASPFSITQSGFQLSFGAVLGIGILGKALENCPEILKDSCTLCGRNKKTERRWMQGLKISAAVQMATAPIVLWHYFQIPVYGVVLNLFVVPLMGYVVISGLLGLLTGAFFYDAGVMAVGSGHYILQFYQYLCEWTSRLPASLLIWGRPKGFQIFLYYLFLGGMILGLHGLKRKEKEWTGDEGLKKIRMQRWGIVFTGSLLCLLCMKPRPQSGLDIAVLDVGQGDGIVLQCEGGRIETMGILWQGERDENKEGANKFLQQAVILIDGGSSSEKRLGENRLEPYLKSEGLSRIDFAVVSHGDADHTSGLLYLLKECPEIEIGCLILPEAGREDSGYEKLIYAAKKRGIGVGCMDAGDKIQAGSCILTCFYPGEGMDIDFSDRNQQSLVIRVDYQDFHMLFTGDVGQEGEKMALDYAGEEALSMVQVLKAAHHGSRFSNGEDFLAAVHPAWTVISYGEGNSYGHPHEETIERLGKEGSTVLETGKMGAVLLHVEEGMVRCRGYKTYEANAKPQR